MRISPETRERLTNPKDGSADRERAIAIDPQFAMAHADLGFSSSNMGQTDLERSRSVSPTSFAIASAIARGSTSSFYMTGKSRATYRKRCRLANRGSSPHDDKQ